MDRAKISIANAVPGIPKAPKFRFALQTVAYNDIHGDVQHDLAVGVSSCLQLLVMSLL